MDAQDAERLGLAKPHGIVIVWLAENGPSLAAGIQEGDVIIKFNGTPIDDTANLTVAAPGTPVKLMLLRDGQEVERTVQSADWPREVENGMTVNTQNLQMRSCPEVSTRCSVIAVMPQGTHVGVLGDAPNGWVKTYVQNASGDPLVGFAKKSFLQ